MTTSVFQDVWSGWTNLVRELVGRKPQAQKRPDLKDSVKPPNRVALKRDLKEVRRPRLRRSKTTIIEPKPDSVGMKREPVEDTPKLQVDPPKPFLLKKELLETPSERVRRIEMGQKKKEKMREKVARWLQPPPITKPRRHLLFMRPGTNKIRELHESFLKGGVLPKWAEPFESHLEFDDNWVYFQGLPLAFTEDKRDAVKKLYFDPKEPSTIQPITDKLYLEWANVSKRDVSSILRSFEVYQLNFGRRRPPKVLSRMSMKGPGVILADMFFPSKNLGWRKLGGVLTMVDSWSRWVQCYAVERKTAKLVKRGMEDYLQRFASLGHIPKVMLCDKGTDLAPAKVVMERYRRKPGKLVLHSTTGKPVQLVEQTQAQIQRRLQVFRTAGLTDDVSEILDDVCHQINHQKRPDRGNLTPIELLKLNKQEIAHVNDLYRDKTHIPEVKGLRTLYVGSKGRVLLMTFKEQVQNKTKGFAPKWSRDIFTVRKKVALQGNPMNHRYFLGGEPESYFRHELLWVPRNTDTTIVEGYIVHTEKLIAEDPLSDEDWTP